MRSKVTVVGAGNVGSTTAQRLVERELADVVLVDIVPNLAAGKGLDLMEAGPVERFDHRILGTNEYGPTEGSDVVVITSGLPRKPGMSRDDLLLKNAEIVQSVTEQVIEQSPDCILVMVANPLDAMCSVALEASRLPPQRVVGMAGVLDAARFRTFVAEELGVSVENVSAFVLGGHGDTMVPLPRYCTVAGIPITKLLPSDRIDAIVSRTRGGGAEIVKLLGTSAWWAPASATAEMVEAILLDKKKILPCSAHLQGEYGVEGLFVGVPVKLDRSGVREVLEIELEPEERAAFDRSVAAVRELVEVSRRRA